MFEVEFKDTKAPRVEGAFVVREGKFFELGDYPDKQFTLNAQEADTAIGQFTPAPLNIEHVPTIFDGKLGEVRKLWRDGKDILAEYAIPLWLNEITKGEPIKVSSEWNRSAKTAVGGALVLNPRVKDAAFHAAFSNVPGAVEMASQAHTDKMQRMHDMTAEMGAECGGKSYMSANVAEFLSPDQLKTVQKLHDLTATFDDHCNRYQTQQGRYGAYYSENRATAKTEQTGKGKFSMLDKIKALFAKLGFSKEELEAAFSEPAADVKPAAETPAKAEMSDTDRAAFTELQEAVRRAETETAALKSAATFTDHKAAITTLKRVFKLTAAEGDKWLEIAEKNPAAFAAALPALEAREPLPQLTGNTVRASASADTDRLTALTTQRMKDTKENYVTAFKNVCSENPDLAASVRMDAREGI